MKFRLEDIPHEGREETFIRDESWLDERLAGEAKRSFHFTGPIEIHVTLSRSERAVRLQSKIEAPVEWFCARCLEPFSLNLTSKYTINLKPRPDFPLPEEVELTREDLETEFYEGDEIDITPMVQDQVLLALPPKAVCREECRGLCPRCGKNLNRGMCQCGDWVVDSRFEALKKFRVH